MWNLRLTAGWMSARWPTGTLWDFRLTKYAGTTSDAAAISRSTTYAAGNKTFIAKPVFSHCSEPGQNLSARLFTGTIHCQPSPISGRLSWTSSQPQRKHLPRKRANLSQPLPRQRTNLRHPKHRRTATRLPRNSLGGSVPLSADLRIGSGLPVIRVEHAKQRQGPCLRPVRKTPEQHKHCKQQQDAGRDRRLVAAEVKANCQQHDH